MTILIRNIKLTVEYDGTNFKGWQRQDGLLTVQGEIEKALFNLTQRKHDLTVAGRTDKGVHAKAQVCNFATESSLRLISFLDGLNRYLPEQIAILKVEEVDKEFNARFSARGRHYEYYILNRRPKSAINAGKVTVIKENLDFAKMQEASKYLLGEHDFSSFRSADCQAKSPITEIYKFDLEQYKQNGEVMIKATIHGRAFLHNMIRIVMGSLLQVGLGKKQPIYIKQVIEAKSRDSAAPTLSPHGLYFTGVDYEKVEIIDYEPKKATE